ncbi:sensor histidine kinase [Microlunatus flavus]|uniref:histidine kinase n=1 Tax=Microlunatus flavus TaxID=1036181 RepID=A0A1H9F693_9ACTN|nr:sensor histidine kinase [Microlunatus flavus]SEQ33504.1 Histidine kinase [Microlunatus flavus]
MPAGPPAGPTASRRRWSADPAAALVAGLFLVLLVVGAVLAADAPGLAVADWLPLLGMTALYAVTGLVAWRRRPHNRIGVLMLVAALSVWVSVLGALPDRALSMIGLVCSTLPLALTLHLLMAFPSGRVQRGVDRVVVGAGYVASTVLQVPLAVVGPEPPAVWRPADAAQVLLVASWVQSVVGVSSVFLAAGLVAVRAFRADPLERRLLGPMVWYRVLLPVMIGVGALAIQVRTPLAVGLSWLQFAAVLGLPVVFLVGLLFGSFGRTGQVDELVARIGGATPSAGALSAAVAQALGDPDARVVFARTGADGFVDEAGRLVPAEPERGRHVHPVRHGGVVVGGIVHRDDALADGSEIEVVGGVVALGIEAERLAAEQRALLAELRTSESDLYASRRRLLQAEDSERRRISRDLHDGAQQHIVLLGLTARQLSRTASDPVVAASAAGIADGMTGLLTELRDFIAGIMPAPLVERGLVPAVEMLAERMPVPTTVETSGPVPPLATDAESTLYFTISEALTNVAKHASATTARVRFEPPAGDGGRLRASVRDDGKGGADPADGTGLRGLQDRVAALGGTLEVVSPDGEGTTVVVEVPCG